MAFDRQGNMYIADQVNNMVRKVDTLGVITTIAGNSGATGSGGDGGPATNATLFYPTCVAVDKIGNVFVADQYNDRVRKVDTAGIITTFAGSYSGFGGDGAPASAAQLSNPCGVCFDTAGNLYIADYGNNRIRKVDMSTGLISTFAGSGSSVHSGDGGVATAAGMSEPWGLASDSLGNIYFTPGGDDRIRKVSPSGIITSIAGNGVVGSTGDGGPATTAELNIPGGMVVDAVGNLYFAEVLGHKIRKISGPASTGIKSETAPAMKVMVYPNPSTDKIYVFVGNVEDHNILVELTDLSGKAVETLQVDQLTNSATFNIAQLPAGEYFCKVTSKNGSSAYKITKK